MEGIEQAKPEDQLYRVDSGNIGLFYNGVKDEFNVVVRKKGEGMTKQDAKSLRDGIDQLFRVIEANEKLFKK